MTRRSDWQSHLEIYLRENREVRFAYGVWDCALFVCGAIEVMTSVDPAAYFRGRYRSRREALAECKEYCGSSSLRSLVNRVTMDLGMKSIKPSFAGRGDIVMLRRGKRGVSLGVVSLSGRSVQVVTPKGLQECTLSLVIEGWRI